MSPKPSESKAQRPCINFPADERIRAKLRKLAKSRAVSMAQVMRDLILEAK